MRPVTFLLCMFYATLFAVIPAVAVLTWVGRVLLSAAMASSSLPIPFGLLGGGGPMATASDMIAIPVLFCMLVILSLSSATAYIISLVHSVESLTVDFAVGDAEALFKKMKRTKFGFAPFWVLCAILAAFCLKSYFSDHFYPEPIFSLFFVIATAVFSSPLTIGALYVHLICTSTFSLAYLLLLRRNGTINKLQFAVHVVLQLMFITDIASTIALVKQHGKSGGTHRSPRSP